MSFILFFAASGFAAPVFAEDAEARACGLPYAVVELMTFVSDAAEFSNGASRIAQGALGLTIEKIELQGHAGGVGEKLGDDAKTALMTLMDIGRSIIRGELPPEQDIVQRHASVLKEAGQAPCIAPVEKEADADGAHGNNHPKATQSHVEQDKHESGNGTEATHEDAHSDVQTQESHNEDPVDHAPELRHALSQPVQKDPGRFGTNLFTHDRPIETHITKTPHKNADLIITDPEMLPAAQAEAKDGHDTLKDGDHVGDDHKVDGHDAGNDDAAHPDAEHSNMDAAKDDHAVTDDGHAEETHDGDGDAHSVTEAAHAEPHNPLEDVVMIALIVLGGIALGARALMGVKDPSDCKVAVKMATDDDTELFGYATSIGRKEIEFGSSVSSTVTAFSEFATSLPKDVTINISGEEHAGQLEWVAAGGAKVKFAKPLKKKQLSAALAWSTLEKEVRKFKLSLPFGKKAKPA